MSYYDVTSDGDDYQRYLRGEPAPTAAAKQPWIDRLRSDIAAGRRWRRVHALTTPLTDCLSDECEWAYTDNVAAGEDVRILDHASEALLAIGDFFILDHQYVVRSHYDKAGLFVGAEVVSEASAKAPYIAVAVRRRLVQLAEDTKAGSRRVVLNRGGTEFQARLARIEESSEHVRTFAPTVVPGLLQTADYARAIYHSGTLTPEEIDAGVADRMKRQELLGADGHRFTLLTTPGTCTTSAA